MSGFAVYPSLQGRGVFITGGATGIGAALVRAFHAQGARVAFVDVDEKSGRALAEACAGTWFCVCDVQKADEFRQTVNAAATALGEVTVLVNNVANDRRHQADGLSDDEWHAALSVNLDPAFLAARTLLPAFQKAGFGSIINFGSINALLGPADMVAYVTAKAGIIGLTKALAREWGEFNIRVNTISPGWVVTERQLALWLTPEAEADWMRLVALKKRITPEDVARLALFLAADDSAMITGQNYVIDGGRT